MSREKRRIGEMGVEWRGGRRYIRLFDMKFSNRLVKV